MPTPYQRFYEAIESPHTKPAYEKYLRDFLEYSKTDSENIVRLKQQDIDDLVFNYLVHIKTRTEQTNVPSPNSYNVLFSPIQLFLEQNDIMLNWKKIKRMYPRRKAPTNQAPYTREDIKKMLEATTSKRNKAFVHFLASTAIRVGALHEISVSDITPVEDGAIVTIYSEDIEEYRACLTPEAYQSLLEYFEYRNLMGYPVTKDSPLFCDKSNYERITYNNSKDLIRNILKKAGLRGETVGKRTKTNKSQNHAFRKRSETIMVNCGIHSKYVEYFMGHFEKQDRHYFKPTDEEIWSNFKKAIPELVVDDSARKEIELQKERAEKSELQKKVNEIEELKHRLATKEQEDKSREKDLINKISKHVLIVVVFINSFLLFLLYSLNL